MRGLEDLSKHYIISERTSKRTSGRVLICYVWRQRVRVDSKLSEQLAVRSSPPGRTIWRPSIAIAASLTLELT